MSSLLCLNCVKKKNKSFGEKNGEKKIITKNPPLNEITEDFLKPNQKGNENFAYVPITKKDGIESEKFVVDDYPKIVPEKGLFDVVRNKISLSHKSILITRTDEFSSVHYVHVKLAKKKKPKAVLFAFHGLGSSVEIEICFSPYFAKHGIEVIGFDMPSFGLSSPKVHPKYGPPGYIYKFHDLCNCGFVFIEKWFEKEKDSYKDVPFFVWGESLGGATVSAMVMSMEERWKGEKIGEKFKGAILSTPAVGIKKNFRTCTVTSMIDLFDCLKVKKVFPKAFLVVPGVMDSSRIENAGVIYNSFKYSVKERFKLVTMIEGKKMVAYVDKNKSKFEIPVIIFMGDSDLTVCPDVVKDFFVNCSSKDKSMILFQGSSHFLTYEHSSKKQADYTIKWILNRCI